MKEADKVRSRICGVIRYLCVAVALVAGLWQAGSVQAQAASFDLHAALAAAQPGATIVVPPGVYPGALTIDKPVTLEGQGLPVIDGEGVGNVITINAPDVTLRGLVIRNSGDSLDAEDAGISAGAPRLTLENNRLEDTLFGIYLHQAVERQNGTLTRHTDLPDAFAAARRGEAGGEWRVHCHVPVFLESFETLGSTQQNLREALALCRTRAVSPHLEVETYTWGVLPDALKSSELAGDIVRELKWVRAELGA